MKSFEVLTISKRTGWEELAKKSVEGQTVLPRKWSVGLDEEGETSKKLWQPMGEVFTDIYVTGWQKKRASNLNFTLNAGLHRIKADYVIFYQDFIELPSDCFEKLLDLADQNTFVTTCTPNYDGSDDSRYLGVDGPRPCRPEEWETNVAIAPMRVLKLLGGFPEHYDDGWSWDNANVAERAAMMGCQFLIDESNRPKLLPHEQTSKLGLELNGERHNAEMKAIRMGEKPLKYDYL